MRVIVMYQRILKQLEKYVGVPKYSQIERIISPKGRKKNNENVLKISSRRFGI